jgi:hypothetical protein
MRMLVMRMFSIDFLNIYIPATLASAAHRCLIACGPVVDPFAGYGSLAYIAPSQEIFWEVCLPAHSFSF